MTTVLQGTGEPLTINALGTTRIIGERINPSGKSKLRQALLDGNWDYVKTEAQRQVESGADVIDVNVGGKGIDEVAVLPETVRTVAAVVGAPLCIDTRVPAALEAALALCPGRPLVNSISAEKKALAEILPIVAEHRLPVIALCMGQEGIPDNVEDRLRMAYQTLEAAIQAGMNQEDIIFDPLVMTTGVSFPATASQEEPATSVSACPPGPRSTPTSSQRRRCWG